MHDTKGNKQVLLLQKLPKSYMTSILKLTLVLLIAYPAKIELVAEQVIEVWFVRFLGNWELAEQVIESLLSVEANLPLNMLI